MNCTQSTSGVSLKWVREGSLTSSTTSQNLDETTPEVAMFEHAINTAYAFKTESEVIAYPNSRRLISDEQYLKDRESSNGSVGSMASVDNTRGRYRVTYLLTFLLMSDIPPGRRKQLSRVLYPGASFMKRLMTL